jgi:hypothetical protein
MIKDKMPSHTVSLSNTFSWSLDWTKKVLLPFDINRWVILAVPAWLYLLMNTFNLSIPSVGNSRSFPSGSQGAQEVQQTIEWIDSNLAIIGLSILGLSLILIIINLILNWLSAFGSTVFTLNVATSKAEISRFWSQYSRQGHSYFLYRASLSLLSILLMEGILLINLLILYIKGKGGAGGGDLIQSGIFQLIVSLILFIPISLIFRLFYMLGDDFLLPIMIWKKTTLVPAIKKLSELIGDHLKEIIVYIIARCLLAFIIGIINGILAFLGCCLTLGLLSLPILAAIPQLPGLVFRRSFSLIYLSQLDPEINLFNIEQEDS